MQAHQKFRDQQLQVTLNRTAHLPLEMAYSDAGQGEPVVLLHGIPTWSYLYHDVIPLLAKKHRVLAPDFLGHGYSDRRDCFDRSLVAQTKAILNFLDEMGLDRVTLVGHDTGGGVALRMAIERPERIQRLVLCNIVAYDSWPIDDMIALGNPSWRDKPPTEIAEFVAEGLADGLHNKDRLTPAFRTGIVAPYADAGGALSLIRNASALNTNHTTELASRHPDIQAPTLVLWGVHDPWQTIDDGIRLAQEIPNAQLHRLEQASHWAPQDVPEEFAGCVSRFTAKS